MQIQHDPVESRFFVETGGGTAELSYALVDGLMDLRHTSVPAEERGSGIGSALVEAAFAHARGEGTKIRPSCPFVRSWVAGRADQQDLLEDGAAG